MYMCRYTLSADYILTVKSEALKCAHQVTTNQSSLIKWGIGEDKYTWQWNSGVLAGVLRVGRVPRGEPDGMEETRCTVNLERDALRACLKYPRFALSQEVELSPLLSETSICPLPSGHTYLWDSLMRRMHQTKAFRKVICCLQCAKYILLIFTAVASLLCPSPSAFEFDVVGYTMMCSRSVYNYR